MNKKHLLCTVYLLTRVYYFKEISEGFSHFYQDPWNLILRQTMGCIQRTFSEVWESRINRISEDRDQLTTGAHTTVL